MQIKSEEPFVFPKGFETKKQKAKRERISNSRKRALREIEEAREAKLREEQQAKEQAFNEFWKKLDSEQKQAFEKEAVLLARATKRDGYQRSKHAGGAVFEQYRRVILLDHFERDVAKNTGSDEAPQED